MILFSDRFINIKLIFIMMFVVVFSSCASQNNLRKKKNCDCPKWSKVEKPHTTNDEGRI